ncbi:B12-binding domain-containing radical SAM protein [Clostridium sp. DL1XJH146]
MKKKKVTLVGINSKFIHSNLAIRYLEANTRDLDYECNLREFSINDRTEKILEEIIREEPDIIGFSCYIWNIELVKSLATLIKIIDKKIKILYGGPEVSYSGKTFLEENPGEYLIEGEGEVAFRKLISFEIEELQCKNGEKESQYERLRDIKGIYFKDKDNKIIYTGYKGNMDINDVVFPYEDMEELNNKIIYYEASRGCPFGCKYCLSSVDRNVRFRDMEKVKKELKFLCDKEVKLVKFVDRTFNCDIKFAMDIWSFLIGLETNTKFHFEISADLMTEEEIELLKKVPKGRFQFEVGIQTTNFDVLNNINRSVNTDNINNKVKEVKILSNIMQHLDLIAGLPGEKLSSLKRSFNDIYAMEPEEIQLGFLKILHGTPMEKEKEKWGIKHSPYPPYEVLKTNDISYKELIFLKKVEAMVDKYYNSNKFNNTMRYLVTFFENPFLLYERMGLFFDEKQYFDRNLSNTEYYRAVLEFFKTNINEKDEELIEIIKYDYLKHNKKRWLPEFLHRNLSVEQNKKIKHFLVQNDIITSREKIHIEKYLIDVIEYERSNTVIRRETYIMYYENTNNYLIISDLNL